MALNQFGAVMSFAIALETQLAELYRAAGETERASACDKRRRKLEQSRRNDVTEITLEAIHGLDEANYALEAGRHDPAALNAAEGVAVRFYSDAAPKINVRESRKVLERCLQEHQELAPLAE